MTPQELKNSILQLAIQGKLVEQRAEEGTAAELVEKITRGDAECAEKNLTHIPRAERVCEADALDIMGTILFQAVPGLRRGIVL